MEDSTYAILIALGIALGLGVILYIASNSPKCVKSHPEARHQEGYTTFIYTGKVMVPIFHPAYDYTADVCDEYEKK